VHSHSVDLFEHIPDAQLGRTYKDQLDSVRIGSLAVRPYFPGQPLALFR